jgi:hypothetical protein
MPLGRIALSGCDAGQAESLALTGGCDGDPAWMTASSRNPYSTPRIAIRADTGNSMRRGSPHSRSSKRAAAPNSLLRSPSRGSARLPRRRPRSYSTKARGCPMVPILGRTGSPLKRGLRFPRSRGPLRTTRHRIGERLRAHLTEFKGADDDTAIRQCQRWATRCEAAQPGHSHGMRRVNQLT